MALDQAFIAATRFGLGPRPGDLKLIAGDPRGWLVQQLSRPQQSREIAALPPPEQQVRRFLALKRELQQKRKQLAQAKASFTVSSGPAGQETDAKTALAELAEPMRKIYLGEVEARTLAAIHGETPLYERLVAFWSNHFTVSIQRGEVAGLCGPFEREAIRPYVLGRFIDMLGAVMRHPAMLIYLDNARSIGPNSLAARRHRGKKLGINENLGRELLELHTLGVNGGYTQKDVEAMARMLTGWTIVPPAKPDGGDFRFEPRIHEPGPKTFLGATYRENGMGEAEAALVTLARHPSTARHLAEKLARHFISDDPPAPAVERIAAVYRRTDGDLRATTQAVIEAPEAWRDPLAKVKAPQDFVISAVRATGFAPQDGKMLVNSLRLLGQAPFAAPSPAGWPDKAGGWLGPEALVRRIEWSYAVAHRLGRTISAEAIAQETIAPVASSSTLRMIASAAEPAEKLALLFASREFQRR